MPQNSKVTFERIVNFSPISEAAVNGGNFAYGLNIITTAKPMVPVGEINGGFLRNSTQFKVSDGKGGGFNDSSGTPADEELKPPEKGTALVGQTAEYAVYPEFGTRFQAPQPSIRPAIAIASGRVPTEVLRAVREETARGVLKAGQVRESFI